MYTNSTNISLSLAVWLAQDDYDHNPDPNTISATSLLKSTKSVLLSGRYQSENPTDVIGLVPSRMGTAIHTAIEQAWLSDKLESTLKQLGINDKVASKIKINPEDPTDCIPIYMEIRSAKELCGYTVTGKFDFICNGALEDFKSTGTYSYINQSNAEKYVLQGSIYRWLNPDIILEDYMTIQYIFTDWSAAKAKQDKNYPQSRVIGQKYVLKSLEETEQYVREKLNNLIKFADADQDEMPACTDEDVWANPPTYKYYKDPTKKTRSTKNFDTYWEAHKRFIDDGSVGEIVTVEGTVGFCRYCPAASYCNQAAKYIEQGRLVL